MIQKLEYKLKNFFILFFLCFLGVTAIKAQKPCPSPTGGTRKPPPGPRTPGETGTVNLLKSRDPNEIIGPVGAPDKRWVSVKDRLPYTITYENSKDATAPAKYVRITTPIEPKQDPTTLQLGSFGFNSTTFSVPSGVASYYTRADARDSIGLFIDVVAGYDQLNNVVFWEFQSIDPLTLQPPSDPLVGFLQLQDSTKETYGHGFVNFSIKPKQSAITLDTISAHANIVFDDNDTIPTNNAFNTIDAFAPTSHITALPATSTSPIQLSWTGADDTNGSGIASYTLYVSTDEANYSIVRTGITRTDTSFIGILGQNYCFFVLATDRTGNTELLRNGETTCTFVGGTVPVTWLYFRGQNKSKDNMLDWATANEQNTKSYKVERSFTGNDFKEIGTVKAAGNSSVNNSYTYTDSRIDKLGSNVFYYRLKQLDINNEFKYSNVVRLNYKDDNIAPAIVYPNPTRGLVTISIGDSRLMGTKALLVDENGRKLQEIKLTSYSQTFDLSSYVNGVYFIKLNNGEALRIVRQR